MAVEVVMLALAATLASITCAGVVAPYLQTVRDGRQRRRQLTHELEQMLTGLAAIARIPDEPVRIPEAFWRNLTVGAYAEMTPDQRATLDWLLMQAGRRQPGQQETWTRPRSIHMSEETRQHVRDFLMQVLQTLLRAEHVSETVPLDEIFRIRPQDRLG